MIKGFNHAGLVVHNIENLVKFYCEVLGLQVIREIESEAPPDGDHTGIPGARRTLVFLGKPESSFTLELVRYLHPPSPSGKPLDSHQLGSSHLCFNVHNLEQFYTSLLPKGVRFLTPPKFRQTPSGARVGICYAQDPEGNWLEFLEQSGEH